MNLKSILLSEKIQKQDYLLYVFNYMKYENKQKQSDRADERLLEDEGGRWRLSAGSTRELWGMKVLATQSKISELYCKYIYYNVIKCCLGSVTILNP